MSKCAICLSVDGHGCITRDLVGVWGDKVFECQVCGNFAVAGEAIDDWLEPARRAVTTAQRAALSHNVRLQFDAGRKRPAWTGEDIESFFASNPALPNPIQQATNIVRFIGDEVGSSGAPLRALPVSLGAKIGSPNLAFASSLAAELVDLGRVKALVTRPLSGTVQLRDVSLTLQGWELYEKERRGELAGSYGFVALKFGDPILDPLLQDHIKPAVKTIGFDVVDLRDVSQAGVIDNLLRIQIRDAAFVLVDLTHENAGAYWEAGYAEGLGKPVLYLCEKRKFDERKTHFDTNHCTTVLWDVENIETFKAELVATLRRSLAI